MFSQALEVWPLNPPNCSQIRRVCSDDGIACAIYRKPYDFRVIYISSSASVCMFDSNSNNTDSILQISRFLHDEVQLTGPKHEKYQPGRPWSSSVRVSKVTILCIARGR